MKFHEDHFDLHIRVLFYPEDGGIVAHALEIDLVGVGHDYNSARQALQEMIMSQLTFAINRNDRTMTVHRAPQEYFDKWEKVHAKALESQLVGHKASNVNFRATCISFNLADIQRAINHPRFHQVAEASLATA